jgi:hypothetical protein
MSEATQKMSGSRMIVVVYWAIFWLLNGLDKFFNSKYFFGVEWTDEFVESFETINISSDLAIASLNVVGILEIVLGLVFAYALINVAGKANIIRFGLIGTLMLFTLFTTGDILFGAGDEKLEHAMYILLAIVSLEFFVLRGNKSA